MNQKNTIPKRLEKAFDLLYLILVPLLGLALILTAHSAPRALWGVMAFVLVGGDAFHLAPRLLAAGSEDPRRYQKALGTGKQITSITMTVFYLLLWHIGLMLFQRSLPAYTALLYILLMIRAALCLLPQNAWTSETPSLRWGIIRNIPFAIQGLMVALLFGAYGTGQPGLGDLWLAIALSFGFYLPVVLFSRTNPKIGMLMLPKTCVYVWIICMGFSI